jgi:hypothetical protein
LILSLVDGWRNIDCDKKPDSIRLGLIPCFCGEKAATLQSLKYGFIHGIIKSKFGYGCASENRGKTETG